MSHDPRAAMRCAAGILACAIAVGASACARKKEAVAVADRFMDLYFLEFDQQKLLPLTVGLAREKIERELALVTDIRRDPSSAKGKALMHYRRVGEGRITGDEAGLTYEVRIESSGSRIVSLTLHRQDGPWRVGNFTIADGAAPGKR